MTTASQDPALQAPPMLLNPGPEYGLATRPFQGIPGIERSPGGRLFALWYAGGPGEGPLNYVILVTSDDDGRTWSHDRLIIDPPTPVRAYDAVPWLDPQGRLWLFWAQSYHLWDGRSGTWAIVCEQPDAAELRWSAPRRLGDGIMMCKPTVLANGHWLLPVSVWLLPPHKDVPPELRHDLGERAGTHVWLSRDQGATFEEHGLTRVEHPNHEEHMVVERRDGSLWMLMRNKEGIVESNSTDGGRTWSTPAPSPLTHVSTRFYIRRLISGRLLLVKHTPPGRNIAERKYTRSHLMAYLSDDDGRTWQGGLMIDSRPEVSYPDGTQAADGTIYIIYDRQRYGDRDILLCTFTEDDILADHPVSTRFRQRVIISRGASA